MKKKIAVCLFCWALLVTVAGTLYFWGRSLTVEMTAPEIVSISEHDGGVQLTWNSVPYATSYRVYRRIPDAPWTLLKVVQPTVLSYTDSTAENLKYSYAVRACNTALGGQSLSKYSSVTWDPPKG